MGEVLGVLASLKKFYHHPGGPLVVTKDILKVIRVVLIIISKFLSRLVPGWCHVHGVRALDL